MRTEEEEEYDEERDREIPEDICPIFGHYNYNLGKIESYELGA